MSQEIGTYTMFTGSRTTRANIKETNESYAMTSLFFL